MEALQHESRCLECFSILQHKQIYGYGYIYIYIPIIKSHQANKKK